MATAVAVKQLSERKEQKKSTDDMIEEALYVNVCVCVV